MECRPYNTIQLTRGSLFADKYELTALCSLDERLCKDLHVILFFYVEWLKYGCVVLCVLCSFFVRFLFFLFLHVYAPAVHYVHACMCIMYPQDAFRCTVYVAYIAGCVVAIN